MERFKDILCVVTTVEASKAALERAVTLAENSQAKLTLVAVAAPISVGMGVPDGGPVSADLQAAAVKACRQELDKSVAPYTSRLELETKVLVGVQFVEIILEVLRNRHDLVIKACEPLDWLDLLFGSEDMHLLRKCPCPVWLINPSMRTVSRQILAAVDVSDEWSESEFTSRRLLNQQIVELATSMALADVADLHIVHAWEAMGESEMRGSFLRVPEEKVNAYVEKVRLQRKSNMESLIKKTHDQSQGALENLKPKVHLVKGWVRKVIPELARQIEADLVVMGTVVRTGIPGFIMGNTAESVLNQLDCSVLAIKPADFVTPIGLADQNLMEIKQ